MEENVQPMTRKVYQFLFCLALLLCLPRQMALASETGTEDSPDMIFLPLIWQSASFPLSADAVAQVLNEVKAQFDALPGVDEIAERKVLVQSIAAIPHMTAAGMADDGAVWGRLSDGRMISIPMSKFDGGKASWSQNLPMTASLVQGRLPAHDRAYVMNALGTCFTDTAPTIAGLLASQNYQIIDTPPTVEGLKTVRDAGVVFFDSHGGLAGEAGSDYIMWTQTSWNLINDVIYLPELLSNQLVYMLAIHDLESNTGKCQSSWHYSITPSFVAAHMTFAPGSFIFFNGCSGMHHLAEGMRQTFASKGASVFAGWTNPVYDAQSVRAAYTMFDLMLGTNKFNIVSPLRHPVNLADAQFYLIVQGWHQLNSSCILGTGSCLTEFDIDRMVQSEEDEFSQLAPTILIMHIDRNQTAASGQALVLEGEYGIEQGQVTIDKESVQVLSWEEEKIVVELPASGKGSAGLVQVSVRNHRSNATPLTEWRGRIQWRENYLLLVPVPGLYAEVSCDLQLRADVHPFRFGAYGDPEYFEPNMLIGGPDTVCHWEMGGDVSWLEASTGTQVRAVLSGSGELYIPTPTTPGQPFVNPEGVVEMTQSRLRLSLALGLARGNLDVYRDGNFAHSSDVPLLGSGILTLPLDGDYSIKAGESTSNFIQGFSHATWLVIPARFPPDATTPSLAAMRVLYR